MSQKSKVGFNPQTQEVENGYISCVTTLTKPATLETNGTVIEVSAFQCDCGCPPCISVLQETISKEDPSRSSISQISIQPEDVPEFIKALKTAQEKIISKRN